MDWEGRGWGGGESSDGVQSEEQQCLMGHQGLALCANSVLCSSLTTPTPPRVKGHASKVVLVVGGTLWFSLIWCSFA